MKGIVIVLLAAAALACASGSEETFIRNDPYLDRVVREAIDLGESSAIEGALSPASAGIFMPLEDASELRASLVSVEQDMAEVEAHNSAEVPNVVLPVAAALDTEAPSLIEKHSLMAELATEEDKLAAEKALIKKQQSNLAKDKKEEAKFLKALNSVKADVDHFADVLEDKTPKDDITAFLDLDLDAVAAEGEAEGEATEAEESAEEEFAF